MGACSRVYVCLTHESQHSLCALACEPAIAAPQAEPATRTNAKRANAKRDFYTYTHDDMRGDHNPQCRAKVAKARTSRSRAALEQLRPNQDGDIRKFVVHMSTLSHVPQEVIEPFVQSNSELKKCIMQKLEAFEENIRAVLTPITASSSSSSSSSST